MKLLSPSLTAKELLAVPVLTLAYMGDAVYEVMVRRVLCSTGKKPGELNREALRFVSAPNQAAAFRRIESALTEEECAVFKRGRNARVGSIPRGASAEEYHTATGLEALLGWLWLSGGQERVNELFLAAFPDLQEE